jgi:hypothetical protein
MIHSMLGPSALTPTAQAVNRPNDVPPAARLLLCPAGSPRGFLDSRNEERERCALRESFSALILILN